MATEKDEYQKNRKIEPKSAVVVFIFFVSAALLFPFFRATGGCIFFPFSVEAHVVLFAEAQIASSTRRGKLVEKHVVLFSFTVEAQIPFS